MIKYNICFIKRGGQLLLLNRERASWMGCWNGIGGKLEQGETSRQSMVREMSEETGIEDYTLHFKGLITWSVDGAEVGGMYTYLAEVADDFVFQTPVKTDEGILDWKEIGWILHESNQGVAANIPRTLDAILNDDRVYDHHCEYENGVIRDYEAVRIEPAIERNAELLEQHLSKYVRESRLAT
ncbi:NUDIX hydrolase [Paenibacillus caui]|uniref:NUDIX hydrolase n=1 Tax=Paenibacillus caui TaxID=2873927 RepID=UPI001CA8DDD5|nr:8-oxo-dGTP diphosphatase [Paenibacillus caui]